MKIMLENKVLKEPSTDRKILTFDAYTISS